MQDESPSTAKMFKLPIMPDGRNWKLVRINKDNNNQHFMHEIQRGGQNFNQDEVITPQGMPILPKPQQWNKN